jgi:hypothetical protein
LKLNNNLLFRIQLLLLPNPSTIRLSKSLIEEDEEQERERGERENLMRKLKSRRENEARYS